ncbi:hypothetical protein E3N88_05428 [Mikania micrantha]|uniref:3-hydroxyacyl-CoA dehydrogenase NAD binding domain-containing protein n=1 Tax=Mikania micrantha TaxID=192012 RepID=A0A5N6PLP2_9ASTR|nr:hypothetical protein E3N88_05428 [Mikania micrantha]
MAEFMVVGVIGAGQMGSGIAQLAAVAGSDVWLLDKDDRALNSAKASITNSIQRFVSKGQMSKEVGINALARLKYTSNLEDLRSADIVIEAIVESEDVKKKLFAELDKIVKGSAILASNTSSISITRIATATKRPHQVIGMHFMNPPPLMKLVEIIRGMKLGTNQPMGPLELADFIGLDVCLSILKVLHDGLGDAKYAPCPLLVQYVDAGRVGRKRVAKRMTPQGGEKQPVGIVSYGYQSPLGY